MIYSSFALLKSWSIKISVIIPTYNRADLLGETIDSFLRQKTDHTLEIIVADNNSTDHTKEVVQQKIPTCTVPIIYLQEPRQGVHYARNHAAKESNGELLYFTDDDMIADENLVQEIAAVFENDPSIGTATGKVLPRWLQQPPDWILKYCKNGWLSLADYGEYNLVSENDLGIWSCHQAVRRDVFFASGGYNPENTSGTWIGDGETGLNIKIGKLGFKFAYTPGSVTYHIIPERRITQSYLNQRLANQGNCDCYTEYRQSLENKTALAKGIITDMLRVPKFFLKSILQKNTDNDEWHMTRAYSYYYRSKSLYNLKLLVDKNFRAMVLKNDWLTEA